MTPVWGADEAVAAWVAGRIPDCARGWDNCRALGVVSGDKLVAGVVFHDWWPEKGLIELSCAAETPRWFTRGVMRVVWGYAFAVARMAVGRHSERNMAARRVWTACGGSETTIPDLYGDGEAAIIATLTKPQWLASRLGASNG